MRIKCRYTVLIVLFLIGLAVGLRYARQAFYSKDGVSWQGITPGNTDTQAAFEVLGQPDQIEERGEYLVYSYKNRQQWGWKKIELWFERAEQKQTVIAVLRAQPYTQMTVEGRVQSVADLQTLDQAIILYGKPEKVTWSVFRLDRYLMWPQKGIAIAAYANVEKFSWEELGVNEVLLFEPMSLQKLLEAPWPWPTFGAGWADHNLFTNTGARDWLPEDPYDWGDNS